MGAENLRQTLWEKAAKEHSAYIEHLKTLSPEEIIEQCYETIMREDIFLTFEYECSEPKLTDEQVKALLAMKYPIGNCYDEWQKSDVTYMDRIQETIDSYTQKFVKEEVEKQKNKKQEEPER